jgi:glyoxylase-like metal-dependent hydrolase (beta-lactamase superfamily II)
MRARYVVFVTRSGTLILWCAALVSGMASEVRAQDADAWRAPFAAGEEARRSGDAAAYAREMATAAEAIPPGHLNRPFVQYHAARAAALDGREADAVRWLRMAWDEGIESLMISFAAYDPAFETLTGRPAFRSVMDLAAQMALSTRPLGRDVHLITGAGSNVVVKVTPEAVLMVDTGYGSALPALQRTIAELGGGGVDAVIVTHPHEDHMGSAAQLGIDAQLYAHSGTAAAMAEPYVFMEGVSIPPKPASARPDTRVDAEMTIDFGGEQIRMLPTVAHTAGDISVYFTDARVAHLGDAFLVSNPMMYPGTVDPDAFLDRLEGFLDAMHPETVVVGGHEEVTDLSAVRAQIGVTRDAMRFVRSSIGGGLTIEETARAGQDRFPPQWTAFFYQLFTQSGR